MIRGSLLIVIILIGSLLLAPLLAQKATLLPEDTLVGLGNTVSGARPLQVLTDITGYTHDRTPEEYQGTWFESELFARKAREYGFSDVEILRYNRPAIWDGLTGELWVVSPVVRKIVDFKDIAAVLAPGSATGTYEGEMVWIPDTSSEKAFEGIDVKGKIILTASSTRRAYRSASSHGALGVVNMNSPRPYRSPDAIQWGSIGRTDSGFAFNISGPMLGDIQRMAKNNGSLTLKAVVKAEWREVDDEVITAVIPGDGSTDEWIYYSAHVFEGINKQGAADDGSGAVLILEAGRTILEAIERGYVSRPARSMRFLWVDEYRGTYAYLNSHTEEFEKVIADINIDMAGQNTTLNSNSNRLYRMPDSRIHFVADVAEEFFEWVGATNVEHVHERMQGYGFLFPLLDPYGTRDPFRFLIEPFYGSSDHQVYNDRGVPAILFNHWPDMVYHSSHDRPNQMDSTQMKRAAFIAAATGLVVAGAPEVDPMQVANVTQQRGKARITRNTREWTNHLISLDAGEMHAFYKDLHYALPQWYQRETRNLNSVQQLAKGSTVKSPDPVLETVGLLARQLKTEEGLAAASVKSIYEATAAAKGVEAQTPGLTAEEEEAKGLIPVKIGQAGRARATGLPGFAAMEVRNFIDGKRSALEIRNAVNSEYRLEYGSISLKAVVDYLKALEKAGSVRMDDGR